MINLKKHVEIKLAFEALKLKYGKKWFWIKRIYEYWLNKKGCHI